MLIWFHGGWIFSSRFGFKISSFLPWPKWSRPGSVAKKSRFGKPASLNSCRLSQKVFVHAKNPLQNHSYSRNLQMLKMFKKMFSKVKNEINAKVDKGWSENLAWQLWCKIGKIAPKKVEIIKILKWEGGGMIVLNKFWKQEKIFLLQFSIFFGMNFTIWVLNLS